ncbi:hypothetical protein F4808DRAFT_460599 [Astrocystis sublimbata]|nr:hypothetical protein F4808DRAFT_460599 [Astrocystis sublimbata]
MSQKITSKNLHYNDSLPPFLARLRGQQIGHSGPDPILAAQRRPGQKRSASEEAEDAPVVVDEDGNEVCLEDAIGEEDSSSAQKELNGREDTTSGGKGEEEGNAAQSIEREKVAGIGAARKRKAGRVIGEDRSDDERIEGNSKAGKKKGNSEADDDARIAKASADVRRLMSQNSGGDATNTTTNNSKPMAAAQTLPQQKKPTVKSAKKKATKKIKLSFGDDEEGE